MYCPCADPTTAEIHLKRAPLHPELATTERLNRAIVGLQLIQRTNDPDSSVVKSVEKAIAPLMKELANRQRAATANPIQPAIAALPNAGNSSTENTAGNSVQTHE
jgi:hypothetical protein